MLSPPADINYHGAAFPGTYLCRRSPPCPDGIAKLLADDASTAATALGLRPFTPNYAAPEQVRGGVVTTATDIYALGALLYELLTARKPYELRGLSAAEIERTICESEPQRPSRVTPSAVQRQLRGDMDTIVLRAMHKEPAHRYASVDALVTDVRRHQAGLPIHARVDAFAYTARKFVRRHAAAVAVSIVLVVALAAGVAGTAWQARAAAREAEKARAVTAFVVSLFQVSDPSNAQGASISARELLDRGAARVRDELAGQPDVQAELLHVLGTIHYDLGLWDTAEQQLREALERHRSLRRGDHSDVGGTLNSLAKVVMERGDLAAAEPIVAEAIAMNGRLGDVRAVSRALATLGGLRLRQGRLEEAIAAHREALGVDRRAFGDDHAEVAGDLNNLGVALDTHGRYAEAEATLREALEMRRRLHTPMHPEIATTLGNLAAAIGNQGRIAEAEAVDREVVAMRRKIYGDRHPWVALSLNNLASRLDNLGRYDEAAALNAEALAIRRTALGNHHSETLASLNAMAISAFRRGDLPAAEAAFREAHAGWTASLGADHHLTLTAANNVGFVLSESRKFADAEPILRDTLRRNRLRTGPDHPDVGLNLKNLGLLLHRTGRPGEAEAALRDSLRICRQHFGTKPHSRTADALAALAEVLVATRPDQAQTLASEALAFRRHLTGDDDPRTAQARRVLETATARLTVRH